MHASISTVRHQIQLSIDKTAQRPRNNFASTFRNANRAREECGLSLKQVTGNERTGTENGESFKWGIFKTGNL